MSKTVVVLSILILLISMFAGHLYININVLRWEYNALMDKYTDLEKRYNTLETEYSELSVAYNALQENYAEALTNIDELNMEVDTLRGWLAIYRYLYSINSG